MQHVAYGTIKFWGTNMFIRHCNVFTSILTFSGNVINTIISPRGPKGARKEGRKTYYKTYVNICTFPYNISQNLIGYGVFTLTHSCKTLN